MAKTELHRLTASEVVRRIKAGTLTSEAYVRACLERIDAREPDVAAWQYLDPEYALAQARRRDRERARGLLHGVPVAFKDIVDTADMPTGYGSRVHQNHRPAVDAACVALARDAGAVVMGKTVTTEFAVRYPGKTANPRDRGHTPGGSSSGSAAAVADGMVPLATGSQTIGSTIRPGAYCGVHAFKPTFGLISLVGLKHLSETSDTIGLYARSLDDLVLFRDALLGLEKPSARQTLARPPRIAFCRTPYWKRADRATQTLLAGAARKLARAGAKVADVVLPKEFAAAEDVLWDVVFFEMARILAPEYREHAENMAIWTRTTVATSRKIPVERYLARLAEIERLQALAGEHFQDFDAILTPAAPGEAPKGLAATGAATFQVIWQALKRPALNLPAFTGPKGLPIGVQLVGHVRQDDRLLAAARWVEKALM
jgi:amidase